MTEKLMFDRNEKVILTNKSQRYSRYEEAFKVFDVPFKNEDETPSLEENKTYTVYKQAIHLTTGEPMVFISDELGNIYLVHNDGVALLNERRNKKLTLEQSEWLWALNRGKYKEYYASRYGFTKETFTIEIGGWIVKDILSSNNRLLEVAFNAFNQSFELYVAANFKNNVFGRRQELSRTEICWMMFSAATYNLSITDLTEIIDGDWKARWAMLDKEFKR